MGCSSWHQHGLLRTTALDKATNLSKPEGLLKKKEKKNEDTEQDDLQVLIHVYAYWNQKSGLFLSHSSFKNVFKNCFIMLYV